jgi:hypothetical protein
MKRLVKIFFILLYFVGTTGFTVVTHYCGGQIDSVSILRSINDSDPCGCDGDLCCDPCCDDEVKNIRVDDLHNTSIKNILSEENQIASSQVILKDELHFLSSFQVNKIKLNFHPPDSPTFIKNHSFLI